jgi:tetratricopeptide (TPR) repeat protein
MSLEDLRALAQQSRESEASAQQYTVYEELRLKAEQLFKNKQLEEALTLLGEIPVLQVPAPLRWRLIALRGHCHFQRRSFLDAQRDFLYASAERPKTIPEEQWLELLILHLRLAATHRELEHIDAAYNEFQIVLEMISESTPFGLVAEAQWGLALIAFAQANKSNQSPACREKYLKEAREHAENACILSRSIGEMLRAATLVCLIGMIEQAMGHVESAARRLQELLNTWTPTLDRPGDSLQRVQERANVVSSAACALAGIELEAGHYEQALRYVDLAGRAAKKSYKLRRADAKIMLGRILEAQCPDDPAAEQAYREAIKEVEDTSRIAMRMRAHDYLGRFLLKNKHLAEGEQQLNMARQLSTAASSAGNDTIYAEDY